MRFFILAAMLVAIFSVGAEAPTVRFIDIHTKTAGTARMV